MKFKPGDRVKIVGSKGGCNGKKCKDCGPFRNKVITIISTGYTSIYNKRAVKCEAGSADMCFFDPRDLELEGEKDWKARLSK